MRFGVVLFLCASLMNAADGDWPMYGHDAGGQRYSPLTAVNANNVSSLKVAWTFHTGDAYQPTNDPPTKFEATPLYVDGTLFIGTPLGRVIALDPVTGKERWSYDSHIEKDAGYGDYVNRGVSTWKPAAGARRIYIATIEAKLIALDAASGKPCPDFGDNGTINLRHGLRIAPRGYADYEETSPPTIVGDTIVVGSGVADNGAVNMPSGEVRGFDAKSGELKWTWDPIPQDSKAVGAETWKNGSAAKTGAANAWSVFVADPARNLVFVPTGSASPDYYGGERLGDNLFANSVVALRADTGERVWHFQTVHHDLWDYDVASPPVLFDLKRDGKTIPAIAVGSKTGHLFILNRETGASLFGVEERPVPKTDVAGEVSAPTQPFPVLPKSLSPEKMSADEAFGVDDADRNWCRAEIAKLRSEGIFTPPSIQGTLSVPGNIGGMAWGGAAYDAANDLLIVPNNRFVAEMRLIPRAEFDKQRDEGRKLGGGWEFAEQRGTPYGMARRFLMGPNHRLPCAAPPWGVITAIHASEGTVAWERPLAQMPGTDRIPQAKAWGSMALGGPIATAGGLVFMGGNLNNAIYAYDAKTGAELWRGELPASSRSTPMTYQGPDGKQYVVVAAGGWGDIGGLGDSLVAFALP